MRTQKFYFYFLAYLNTPLLSTSIDINLLKSDIYLNFNKLLFKAMSFKCHPTLLTLQQKKKKSCHSKSFSLREIFLSSMWREMLTCNVSHPAICIDSRIQVWYLVSGRCSNVWHVFSFYLKMPRTKKLAPKRKFRRNKFVRVNKETVVSEEG
jgi:hypothetical protein